MSPVAAEAKAANLYGCGCVPKLADKVGAELAVTGVVHKVSNLILNITIYVLDVKAERYARRGDRRHPLEHRPVMARADSTGSSRHRLAGALAALGSWSAVMPDPRKG